MTFAWVAEAALCIVFGERPRDLLETPTEGAAYTI